MKMSEEKKLQSRAKKILILLDEMSGSLPKNAKAMVALGNIYKCVSEFAKAMEEYHNLKKGMN